VADVRPAASRTAPRRPAALQVHHVTEDYSHVRRDLLAIAAVGAITLGFIVALAFVI
jgi:hypothetical protein